MNSSMGVGETSATTLRVKISVAKFVLETQGVKDRICEICLDEKNQGALSFSVITDTGARSVDPKIYGEEISIQFINK